jgi:A/G-specific adenine glycosylase
MQLEKESINHLIRWSKTNYHSLPWRTNRTFYTTLVSEIMLQQTTVQTVLNKFDSFLEKFPTLEKLAKASEEQVLIAWKGLGYYRRAKNLLKACQYINQLIKKPEDVERHELMEIPGVGEYTASALWSIGMNRRALAVDANIFRVFNRLFDLGLEKSPKNLKLIESQFMNGDFISKGFRRYRELNEAIMDLGRSICRERKVDCLICPLKQSCVYHQSGQSNDLDRLVALKVTRKTDLALSRHLILKGDRILFYRKNSNEWLSGQLELPTFVMETKSSHHSNGQKFDQYPVMKSTPRVEKKFEIKQSITKYKIINSVYWVKNKSCVQSIQKTFQSRYEWVNIKDLEKKNISTICLKILKKLNYEIEAS